MKRQYTYAARAGCGSKDFRSAAPKRNLIPSQGNTIIFERPPPRGKGNAAGSPRKPARSKTVEKAVHVCHPRAVRRQGNLQTGESRGIAALRNL